MNHDSPLSTVEPQRAALALLIAAVSTLVNYGDVVPTLLDAVLWFVFFAPTVYLLLTVITAATNRLWR